MRAFFATLGLQAFPCGKSVARCLIIWAFPHIYVRSGYILGATTFASLVTRLLKRSLAPENIKTKLPASLRPKGSLSLTRMRHILPTLSNYGEAYRDLLGPPLYSILDTANRETVFFCIISETSTTITRTKQ